jgi:membrane-bound serine protease (ClpP class)
MSLDAPIGPGSAGNVARSLRQAQTQDAAVAVLLLDTLGGLDNAMRDIIRRAERR